MSRASEGAAAGVATTVGLLPWIAVVVAFAVSDYSLSDTPILVILLDILVVGFLSGIIAMLTMFATAPIVNLVDDSESESSAVLLMILWNTVTAAIYFPIYYYLFQWLAD